MNLSVAGGRGCGRVRLAGRWRLWGVAALLLLAWASVGALSSGAGAGVRHAGLRAGMREQRTLSALPAGAWGAVSAALGRGDPAYRVDGLSARNSAQGLSLRFTRAGVVVGSGKGEGSARLGLAAVGRSGSLARVAPVAPRVAGDRVSYARGLVREWFVNGPLGVEQGFDIARRPAGRGALRLDVGVAGARVRLVRGGGAVLSLAGGGVLRYGRVSVVDARGRALPARLALARGGLAIVVNDRGAEYPLRVDPFIQQGDKLVAGDALSPAAQGFSVALSADGDTALVGGDSDNYVGAAWVFTLSGGTWSEQAKLVASDLVTNPVSGAEFGFSVALSADGNTALIGAPGDGQNGGAWVFTRSGGAWTQQGGELVGSDAVGNGAEQGWSVALSADGNTALIGGPDDNYSVGAAWVFTRSGGTWTQQGGKLFATNSVGYPEVAGQGTSVALSADGNTALIGGPSDSAAGPPGSLGPGAAWVFTRSADGAWGEQAKLTAPAAGAGEEVGDAGLGWSVALSGDGDTALAGGPDDNGGAGAAWAFTNSGGTWSEQGGKLVASQSGAGAEVGVAYLGTSVALSGDGNTALVGGPADNKGAGATWVFTRSGGTWTEQGSPLVGSGAVGNDAQGTSVALSGDGYAALVGGPADNGGAGAAWLFATPGIPTSTSVTSSQNPVVAGQSETFTANVTSTAAGAPTPAGTVTFLDNGTAIGTGTLTDGQASLTTSALAVGDHTITASFSGDPGFADSTGSLAGNPLVVSASSASTTTTPATTAPVGAPAVKAPSNRFTVSRIRATADGVISFRIKLPGPGRLELQESAWRRGSASGAAAKKRPAALRRFLSVSERKTMRRAGTATVTIRPSARGRRLIARSRTRVTLRLRVSYTPTHGRTRTRTFNAPRPRRRATTR